MLKATFNKWESSDGVLNGDMDERGVERIQQVESLHRRPHGATNGENRRVYHTRRQQRVMLQEGGERIYFFG